MNKGFKHIDDHVTKKIKEGDPQTIKGLLETEGINSNDFEEAAKRVYKQAHFVITRSVNSIKHRTLLQRAAEVIKDGITKDHERPVSYLRELIRTNKFAIQYRNLDKLSIDEIQEIIKDQNLLEILEDLDGNDQS